MDTLQKIYAWGKADKYQLGNERNTSQRYPVSVIPQVVSARLIGCGMHGSFLHLVCGALCLL